MKFKKRKKLKNAFTADIGKGAMIRMAQHEGLLPYADVTPRKEDGKWVANVPKLRKERDGSVTVVQQRSRTTLLHFRRMDRDLLRKYLIKL